MAHSSLAERFAFSTPGETVSKPHTATVQRSTAILIARILIGAIFLVSGLAKLADPAGAVGYMTKAGIPAADVLVYVAGFAEILGGLAVISGFLARVGAIGLFVFMAITTLTMHAFWNFEGQEMAMQNVQFMKNLSIMGGLLMLWATGPGRFSIDAKVRRPHSP
jgi:putative oxidoreductase